jgi:hypothetical protein
VSDTRTFNGDTFFVGAAPFQTAADFSVFDHIKYLALSNQAFPVPETGSITFSTVIEAETVGTDPSGRVIHGVYGPPGCADDPGCAAAAAPWEAVATATRPRQARTVPPTEERRRGRSPHVQLDEEIGCCWTPPLW